MRAIYNEEYITPKMINDNPVLKTRYHKCYNEDSSLCDFQKIVLYLVSTGKPIDNKVVNLINLFAGDYKEVVINNHLELLERKGYARILKTKQERNGFIKLLIPKNL